MRAKNILSILMALIIFVSAISAVGIISADAASNPYFTNKSADSITHNTAHVHAYVQNPGKFNLIEAGCIIKAKNSSWSKTFVDKGFSFKTGIDLDYYIGTKGTAKGTKLSPSTNYTYQFYVKAKGQSNAFYSAVCSFTTKADANKPSFSSLSHSKVTYNDAYLFVKVNNPAKKKITEVGVKVYSTDGKFSKTLTEKQILTSGFDLYYQLSNNKVAKLTLSPNTAYKYQFYIIAAGYGKITSGTGTFTTPTALPSVANKATGSITKTGATINASISNTGKYTLLNVGFQLGTVKNKWTSSRSQAYTSNNLSFNVSGLTKNTTYYYRCFVKAKGGNIYYSPIASFTTLSDATKIRFPLPMTQVWSASTYLGHGSAFGSTYSSVDIVLKNGKSAEGFAVFAAADGKVIYYGADNGQIVIEHNTKLVTTNNKTYTKWYTVYAHMKNIKVKVGNTVKSGQQIGQVSKVGNATGPHLHFNIISGNGNTKWTCNDKNKAISPYYVFGFVLANGKDTSYCVCDRQGPAVTSTLINWKPTGK